MASYPQGQIKLWVHQKEISNIQEHGYPNRYFFESQGKDFVEMTIGTEQFLEWQLKKSNPIQERSKTGRQILND